MNKEILEVIFQHRSVRKYKAQPIPPTVLEEILEAGCRASTTGNMQLYSVIVTQDAQKKKELAPLHFNQPMVTQAPVVLTILADVRRFHHWCKINDAEKSYDNFLWFVNACIDSMLFAQNICVAAEARGLGFCYLGTTVYTAAKIAEFFQCPDGVVPLTTITMGYPDEVPDRSDRLPLKACVHQETFHDYTDASIREFFREKENSEQTKRLLEENRLPNLAQIFTKKRYTRQDGQEYSRLFLQFLEEQGFMNQ